MKTLSLSLADAKSVGAEEYLKVKLPNIVSSESLALGNRLERWIVKNHAKTIQNIYMNKYELHRIFEEDIREGEVPT